MICPTCGSDRARDGGFVKLDGPLCRFLNMGNAETCWDTAAIPTCLASQLRHRKVEFKEDQK